MPTSLRREKDYKYTATAACLAEPHADKRLTPRCRFSRICHHLCGVLFLTFLGFAAVTPVFGQSTLPLPSDGIQYVGARGSNANNGLSRGNAKASILAAFAALPPCHSGRNWAHCGSIKLGAGTYMISSPIVVSSPQVSIRGQGQGVTILDYTGTSGCAIEWTGYENGSWRTGGLYDLTIDGAKAGPGTCGLKTYDMVGFNARNVQILNFSKPGSIGWEDTAVKWFNERYNVSMTLYNNTTGWLLEGAHGRPGYPYPNTTFGYGNFSLWINTSANGQVGIRLDNYGLMAVSLIHVIENLAFGSTGLEITNHSQWDYNVQMFHAEGPSGTIGLNLDSTSVFSKNLGGVMGLHQLTNTINGLYGNLSLGYYINGLGNIFSQISAYPERSPALFIGSPSDAKYRGALQIAMPSSARESPFAIDRAGRPVFSIDPNGNLHASDGYLISAGTIRLSGGKVSHAFKTLYTSAPVCTATDTSSANAVKVISTTKEVTITGSGNDMVTWICTPAAN